jgi:hypothetical protein
MAECKKLFLGIHRAAEHPTKEPIPVWIGDYVLAATEQVQLWRFLVATKIMLCEFLQRNGMPAIKISLINISEAA